MTEPGAYSNGYGKQLSFIVALLLVPGIALVTPHLQLGSNQPFHQNISLISAVTSFFAGALALVRYYAKKVCPFLWIGIAFLGTAVIELVYSYVFAFFPAIHMPGSVIGFVVWGRWPWEYKDKIFTLFQTLRRDDHSGIGVGLAICKKVVSLHGGNIWYTSDASGTTFSISLPMP